MIRLRRSLERGRSHPVLGPLMLVLLALLLALTCLHAAHEGWDGIADLGMVCVAFVGFVGIVLTILVSSKAPVSGPRRVIGRDPPQPVPALAAAPSAPLAALAPPLRR